ncbi:hypothetical protein [Methylicorpusculum sp.]|uniref:hypothetical protein n=1 Tax=Methylicorpusculum sp. TaxID=2713644 RepID=UPI002AB806F6|nr:hypothetical protein [Methylicorpusculum sp.]MDZ4153678.1 hypothetical protein [Methylicorpusculum sp.]
MAKKTFLFTVLGAQLMFIFLLIHKSSQFIKESYQKQKIELIKNELAHRKELLTNQLYANKNPAQIKKFAQEQLNMQPIKISQLKRIARE